MMPEKTESHEPGYWLRLTEAQATDLASGYVRNSVKSMIRELLDHHLEDERRAARPLPKTRTAR